MTLDIFQKIFNTMMVRYVYDTGKLSSNTDVIPPRPWRYCYRALRMVAESINVTILLQYAVEVTLEDKSKRRIDALGQDAIMLYRNVMKIKQLSLATN